MRPTFAVTTDSCPILMVLTGSRLRIIILLRLASGEAGSAAFVLVIVCVVTTGAIFICTTLPRGSCWIGLSTRFLHLYFCWDCKTSPFLCLHDFQR